MNDDPVNIDLMVGNRELLKARATAILAASNIERGLPDPHQVMVNAQYFYDWIINRRDEGRGDPGGG